MSTIHLTQTTTATPEQYSAGLTDVGPGRSKLFGNGADVDLMLHSEALPRRRHGGLGRRRRAPGLRLVRSRSGARQDHRLQHLGRPVRPHIHVHTAARRDHEIDYVVLRDGKTLKGRLLSIVLGTVGRRVLASAFVNSVKAIEARNAAATAEHA